jgi:hypothetical protein
LLPSLYFAAIPTIPISESRWPETAMGIEVGRPRYPVRSYASSADTLPGKVQAGNLASNPTGQPTQVGCKPPTLTEVAAMSGEARPHQETTDERLYDLLSEVWHADTLADNPRTREFLDAGQELLHSGLARSSAGQPDPKGGGSKAPFDELLAWVSRRKVVDYAASRYLDGESSRPTEAAFRYRWRTQAGYLRDLVIYALRSRMATPKETAKARDVLFKGRPLDKAIDQIAYDEVRDLNEDPAFRLQMVFQAILAHDDHVANALRRIDKTNFETWRDFYQEALDKLGIKLRPDVDLDDFAYALQAAGEGVVFRSLLPVKSETSPAALAIDHKNKTSRPLALIAMALLVAFADPGDGKPLREVVGKFAALPDDSQQNY